MECVCCGDRFFQPFHRDIHMRCLHEPVAVNASTRTFYCKFCIRTFDDLFQAKDHMKEEHLATMVGTMRTRFRRSNVVYEFRQTCDHQQVHAVENVVMPRVVHDLQRRWNPLHILSMVQIQLSCVVDHPDKPDTNELLYQFGVKARNLEPRAVNHVGSILNGLFKETVRDMNITLRKPPGLTLNQITYCVIHFYTSH